MYAFEFEGNVKNGFIELPEEYKNKVNTIVKVIVMQDKPIDERNTKIKISKNINDKIKNFIDFTNNNAIQVTKIEIPDREERNAR